MDYDHPNLICWARRCKSPHNQQPSSTNGVLNTAHVRFAPCPSRSSGRSKVFWRILAQNHPAINTMDKIHLYVQTCCRSHPDPQQWTLHADGQVSSVWNKCACDKICVLLGNAPVPFNSHVWSTDFIYNEWKGTEFVKSALYILTTPSKATVHIYD